MVYCRSKYGLVATCALLNYHLTSDLRAGPMPQAEDESSRGTVHPFLGLALCSKARRPARGLKIACEAGGGGGRRRRRAASMERGLAAVAICPRSATAACSSCVPQTSPVNCSGAALFTATRHAHPFLVSPFVPISTTTAPQTPKLSLPVGSFSTQGDLL